jgi:hypothetical protein
MGSRSYNRPSYVAAILLIVVALIDAIKGLNDLQVPDVCKNVKEGCGVAANSGWYVDLGMAVIAIGLATLLLLRPERLVYAATAAWAAVAFLGNIVGRHSTADYSSTIFIPFFGTPSGDVLATFRCAVYLLVFVIAGILFAFEWQAYMLASAAEKAAAAKAAGAAGRPAGRAPARRRLTR